MAFTAALGVFGPLRQTAPPPHKVKAHNSEKPIFMVLLGTFPASLSIATLQRKTIVVDIATAKKRNDTSGFDHPGI